ncbi:hypothetical protein VSQ48_15055, partial [Candidatus Ventrimonas sp. KK005]
FFFIVLEMWRNCKIFSGLSGLGKYSAEDWRMEKKGRNALFFCKKVLIYAYNRRIIIIVRRERNENKRPD